VLCCSAVGGAPLLHCAWLVVRVGVLWCIVVGGDSRTPLLRCARPHRCAWLFVRVSEVGVDPRTYSLSLLFADLSALHNIHEAPSYVFVLKNPQACDALPLRRQVSSRIALLFRGGLGLRRRPLALGLVNAQRYETNDAS
jgi:hypothetical protein